MQASDFTSNLAGRLVEVGAGIVAFVPAPLPAQLPLNDETIRLLAAAERALGRLTGTLRAAQRQVNPHLITAPLLRREAISSSRIEGTNTTPEQLVLMEIDPDEARGVDAVAETKEVLNYIAALHHGFDRLPKLPISLRLIQELHEILMRSVRGDAERPGELRTVQNFIGTGRDIRAARFVPPPVSELRRCLDELERYVHDPEVTLPHLVRLALVHYQFEAIHPFRDGNGRVGRLLIPLLLCTYEKIEAPVLYMSPHLERHRSKYTDLLLRVSQKGDFSSWIEFFLESVQGSADESTARAEALLELRETYHRKLHSARSSTLLLKLVDALFERPSMTLADAAKILSVTPASAGATITKLAHAGIISEVTGQKRHRRFIAREILSVAHS